jgi:hypothetical protein
MKAFKPGSGGRPWKPLCAAIIAVLLSCKAGNPEPALVEENRETGTAGTALSTVPALSVADALRLPEGTAGRRMLLEEGNIWARGIPGFGENALSALRGSYRIEALAGEAEGGESFRVWLSREVLFYDNWQTRTSIATEAFPVLEKTISSPEGDSLRIAGPFNGIWSAVFSFEAGSRLSQNDIDRIVSIYRTRFLYFLGLSSKSSDISLPARADF